MINKFVSSLDYTGIAESCTLNKIFVKLATSLATVNEAIHQKILEYQSLLPNSFILKLDIDQLAAIETIEIKYFQCHWSHKTKNEYAFEGDYCLMKLTRLEVWENILEYKKKI